MSVRLLRDAIAASVIAGCIFAGYSAHAQQPVCAARAEIVDILGEMHEEARRSYWHRPDGAMLEIFAAPNGGTWTMLLTRPDGVSCVLGHGEGYVEYPPVPGKRGA